MTGKRIVVLCENLYEEMELWYPVYRLREAGHEVLLVGTGAAEYTGKHGLPAVVDRSIDVINPEDVDGVIVPGGYAPDKLRRYPAVLELVRRVHEGGRLVASICHGPWVLASAGILPGKRLTCVSAIRDDVVNAGGLFEDAEVVVDGNLITSRTPDDLPVFLPAILGFLEEMNQ